MTVIYIDADACPVKAEAERVATRHGVRMVSGVEWRHPAIGEPVGGKRLCLGWPRCGRYVDRRTRRPGDVVVTGDIPLAAKCVAAGAQGAETQW